MGKHTLSLDCAHSTFCSSEPIGGKRLDSVHTEQLVNGMMGTSINGIGDISHGEQRRAHSAESISAIGSIADVSTTEQRK